MRNLPPPDDNAGVDALFGEVYDELRAAAARLLAREQAAGTLQPTALVHEAWLKLEGSDGRWRDRGHFVALAARAMRQVLVDHARRRDAAKRGGGQALVTLEEEVSGGRGLDAEELLALDAALERLGALDPRLRQVVELRYFGGLGDEEIGAVLGVTGRTAQRDWARARAWLHRELSA
jgi:RNA polymerase sigma factor (TIGR02999 family)